MPAEESRVELIGRILGLEPAMHRAMGPSQMACWLDVELSMSQLKMLFVLRHLQPLSEQGGVRVGELARALGVTLPTVSVVVDRLVERDLVRREEAPDDRRQHLCRLAEAGQALVDRLMEGSRQHTAALLAYLSETELAQVLGTMELLIGASARLRQGQQPGCAAELANA